MQITDLTALLEPIQFKVTGFADSLDEARDTVKTILKDSPESDIDKALNYYHNTLIETVRKEIWRSNHVQA